MENIKATRLQAKLFDFALTELVYQHRNRFKPQWTIDSWAKFLIWMALNCGLSGERASLEFFAESLGSVLSSRMRRIFFERTLDELALKVMADPADENVLILASEGCELVTHQKAGEALVQAGLLEKVVQDRNLWIVQDALIAIPWHTSKIGN